MSNSGGGWRAYRPSRGKRKTVNSVGGGGSDGSGNQRQSTPTESNENVDPQLRSKAMPTIVNAWASGPPAVNAKLFQPGRGGGIGAASSRGGGRASGGGGSGNRGGGGYSRGQAARGGTSAFNARSPPSNASSIADGEAKFADVAGQHQAAIKRHLLDIYVSSSEDEEEEEDANDVTEGDAGGGNKSQRILNNILEKFSCAAGRGMGHRDEDVNDDDDDVAMRRTYQLLTSCLGGEGIVCLICISNVKKSEAIWTCQASCFSMFHLGCIQKWVNEGAYQQAATATLSAAAFPTREIPWQCPKCRFDYPKAACPTRYFCYCGKEPDPTFTPWNLPHSCGELCEKPLMPDCGHHCLLLCHPGPCPPCPQTVRNPCYCGNGAAKVKRCGNRKWSCGKLCGKSLNCGLHDCKLPCHDGECLPCNKKSVRRCRCGREESLRPCSDPPFDCGNVCGKVFPCGNHVCERVCHEGEDCGDCPLTNRRTCPCGKKQVSNVSCTLDIPGCGDTCEKLLKCRKHRCNERCHAGACATCRDVAERKCRCGRHRKKIQCSDENEFHCQDKCQRLKDCERHQCKRKCCDGNCPPCENACGRTLACGKHKCVSRCHVGRCYPCTVTKDLKCFCGFTVTTFPCGDRSAPTAPPRCVKSCRLPSNCHHLHRKPHRCHYGACPPCVFVCDEPPDGCDHRCAVKCHDNVAVEILPTVKRAGPWEKAPEKRVEIVKQPCPPCPVPVGVICLGQHESHDVPCSQAAPWSCGVICGRFLKCENHVCELPCHEVVYEEDGYDDDEEVGVDDDDDDGGGGDVHSTNDSDDDIAESAGLNCRECERPCTFPRPPGCVHPCAKGFCHPAGLCPPCLKMVKFRCHCKNMVKHLPCRDVNGVFSDETLEATKSCGGLCPRLLVCGHPCTLVCHSGACANPADCRAKVLLKCACKRLKKEFPCVAVQSGEAKMDCDDKCRKLTASRRVKEAEEAAKREEEERIKNAQIAAEFERRQKGPKRSRRNKTKSESDSAEAAAWWRKKMPSLKSCLVGGAVALGLAAVVAATILGLEIEN